MELPDGMLYPGKTAVAIALLSQAGADQRGNGLKPYELLAVTITGYFAGGGIQTSAISGWSV